jgi:hypothetical protein
MFLIVSLLLRGIKKLPVRARKFNSFNGEPLAGLSFLIYSGLAPVIAKNFAVFWRTMEPPEAARGPLKIFTYEKRIFLLFVLSFAGIDTGYGRCAMFGQLQHRRTDQMSWFVQAAFCR